MKRNAFGAEPASMEAHIYRACSTIMDVLRPLLPLYSDVALVDFPNHNNVGDSAIWLGEKRALQVLGARVVYQCDLHSYSPEALRARLGKDGIVLLHGGGNFGSVWPQHQLFREQVLRDFPSHRIIQLPQSVYISNDRQAETTRLVIGDHPSFRLLVRDYYSADVVSNSFGVSPTVCPDMAFMLGPLSRPKRPQKDVVWLGRTDHESSQGRPRIQPTFEIEEVDWLVGEKGRPWSMYSARATVRARTTIHSFLRTNSPLRDHFGELAGLSFDTLARLRVARGLRILSRGRAVITDRLHGHILSTLLRIPHVLLDNKQGKVRNYYSTFSCGMTDTQFCSDPDSAVEAVGEYLR